MMENKRNNKKIGNCIWGNPFGYQYPRLPYYNGLRLMLPQIAVPLWFMRI